MEEQHRERADEAHLVGLPHPGGARRLALLHEPLDGFGPEQADRAQVLRVQQLAHVVGRARADERGHDRRAVRALAARRDLGRDQRPGRLPEEVLLLEPSHLHRVGERRGELGHAVVEEREPALDRVPHEHPVALRVQEVRVEEGHDLEVLRLAERRELAEVVREPGLDARAAVAFERGLLEHPLVEQAERAAGVGEAKPVAVQRVVDVLEPALVEAGEERARALQVLPEELVQPREEQRPDLGVGHLRPEPANLVLAVDVVAAEELVRALARDDDLEACLADGGGQPQQRRQRGAQRRLLGELDRAREQLGDVGRVDDDAGEVGPELAHEAVLELALVEERVAEPDAERVQRAGIEPARERRRDGRVEAAAQVRGDRDVGAQPDARRVGQELRELLLELRLGLRALLADAREPVVPPAPLLDQPVGAPAKVVRGSQLADADERRAVGQDRPDRERLDEPERIELTACRGMAKERLRLGAEDEIAVELREEERPDAEAVPRDEDLLRLPVPDREREVAVQPREAVDAPLVVGMGEHLRVGRRLEPVAQRAQLVLELDVVVDLAVLHHPVAAALVRERLVAALEIDDREPGVRHAEPAVEIEADAVGTTMTQLSRHGEEKFRRGVAPRPGVDARNPAHSRPTEGYVRDGSAQGSTRCADTL